MSGGGRKRSSKWDLREELEFLPDSKKLQSGWSSANAAGRVSNKDDILHKDYNRDLDTKMAWDEDESHGMKMSPGFEEWRHKRHSQSPKNGWDRPIRFCSLLGMSLLPIY